MWIICDVYENDMSFVHVGEYADIHLAAYPNVVLKGRIDNIAPTLDPNIRTDKVRLEVENPGLLRFGMFVTATFHGMQKANARHGARHGDSAPARSRLGLRAGREQSIPAHRGGGRRHACRAACRRSLSGIQPGQQVVSNALVLAVHGGAVRSRAVMIRKVVDFALNNRFIVLAIALLLLAWGAISFHNLPVEAYPDVANNYVESSRSGRAFRPSRSSSR